MLRHPARLAGSSLLRLQSDERLASLAVDGHEAAFAAIVDRYRPPLQRYCSRIVGPARAEDAVQQTLISAHDALKRTTEVRHLRSWLYRIAHNTSLNVLRSVRDDVPLDPAYASLADGPEAAFERGERLRETLVAVQELPERQRAALVLRELEGRSHEEIATALGVTSGSARQSLMRARAAVRSAVTAVTPYPLVAKLAGALTSSPATAGWAEAATSVGAGATIAKLTAGVMASGALVGGAVGTERIVNGNHRSTTPPAAAAEAAQPVTPAATPAIDPANGGLASSTRRIERAQREASARRPVERQQTSQSVGAARDGASDDDDAGPETTNVQRREAPTTTSHDRDQGRGPQRDAEKAKRSGGQGTHRVGKKAIKRKTAPKAKQDNKRSSGSKQGRAGAADDIAADPAATPNASNGSASGSQRAQRRAGDQKLSVASEPVTDAPTLADGN